MLFPISVADKNGYINEFGREVVDPRFVCCSRFAGGCGHASEGDQNWLFDETGRLIAEFTCEWAFGISDGRIPFTSKQLGCGKHGYRNLRGEVVIPERFDSAHSFQNGYAVVEVDGKSGVINRSGEYVMEPREFDYLWGPDEHGVLAAEHKNLWGYVTIDGRVTIPLAYARTFMSTEGLGRVIRRRKTGFISASGDWTIPDYLEGAESFSGGYAVAQDIPGAYGFIGRDNCWIGDERYIGAKDFKQGLAPVAPRSNARHPKWGFMDQQTEMVISPRFLAAESFDGPLACVTLAYDGDQDHYGYIDQAGTLVWEGKRRVSIDDDSGQRFPL